MMGFVLPRTVAWMLLATVSVFGIHAAASANPGQTSASSEKPPEIPYKVLALSIGGFGSNGLQLTEEQRTRIQKIQTAHVRQPMIISRLRNASGIHYANQGLLERAIKLVEQEFEDQAARQILAVLTQEQIDQFRSKHRGSIQRYLSDRVSSDLNDVKSSPSTLYQVGVLMQNHDLLTLLEGADSMDALQLSDSQYSELMRIREEAWPRAQSTMRDCYELVARAEEERAKVQSSPAPVNPVLVKLMEQSMQVLSPEQQEDYRRTVAQLHQQLNQKIAANPSAMMELIATHQVHGQPVEIRTEHRNGKPTVHVRLHNFFAIPEHAQTLNVTEEQQAKIAELLAKAETESAVWMQDANAVSQQADSVLMKQLQELVAAFHQSAFDPIMAMLTVEQKAILQDHRLRQLGLESLRLTEIQSELGLSEEQREQVVQVLNQPMAFPDTTTVISVSESKKQLNQVPKTPEEARQRFEEHRKEFEAQNAAREKQFRKFTEQRHREIWEVLTPDQRDHLKQLTALTDPGPPL